MENHLHINNYDIRYDVINVDDEVLRLMVHELFHRMQIHGERRAAR